MQGGCRRFFRAFVLASAKPKKERKSAKKKERNKSAERDRKKREFTLFSPSTVENRFQSPKLLDGGESKGLE
jgi:hypothetical protein